MGTCLKESISSWLNRTVQYHPDKIASAEARPAAEAYYVHLKLCRDILVDPAKRFAYDRFGPEMLSWRQNSSIRDFVTTGIRNLATYYVGTGAVLILLGVMGYLQQAPMVRKSNQTNNHPFLRDKHS